MNTFEQLLFTILDTLTYSSPGLFYFLFHCLRFQPPRIRARSFLFKTQIPMVKIRICEPLHTIVRTSSIRLLSSGLKEWEVWLEEKEGDTSENALKFVGRSGLCRARGFFERRVPGSWVRGDRVSFWQEFSSWLVDVCLLSAPSCGISSVHNERERERERETERHASGISSYKDTNLIGSGLSHYKLISFLTPNTDTLWG